MWLELVLISIMICFIVDLSGITGSIKWLLWERVFNKIGNPENIKMKPFDCSLCMTFWVGIIYLIVCGSFSLPYLFEVCVLSLLSKNITGFLRWTQDALISIENMLYRLIQKL